MSQKVDMVRAGFAAYRRGDLPAMLDHFAPDVIVTTRPDQPDARDFRGHDGLMQQLNEWVETWEGFSIEIRCVREVGDAVIVLAHETGRGARSGIPMDGEVWFVFNLNGGKVSRWQMFGSEAEALEAAGAIDQTIPPESLAVVRESLDAYARRDVAALRALNHSDMELDWSTSRGFQAGVYRGFDAALRFYREYFEVFDEIVFEPLSFIEAGDSIVVPNVAHQRGRDGIEVNARSALAFTLRDGRISRICLYQHAEEALAAMEPAE